MNRKTLIVIVVLAIVLLGAGGYLYFSKTTPTITPSVVEFPGSSRQITGVTGVAQEGATEAGGGVFTPGTNTPLPRLYELHKDPVAGVAFIETKDKKGNVLSSAVRYIERGLGYIFETGLSTYAESRIVNETRSRLSEALWGNGGKSVVIRSVDDKEGGVIKTRIVNIGAPATSFVRSTSTEPAVGEFLRTEEIYLPDYIPFMALSEDGADKLFYLEGGTGSTATFKDTGVSKIFNSAFTEWLPQFPSQKLITLTTRPSAKVPGYLFFLDPGAKSATKILGNINGLTTLTSRDGKFVLSAETKDNVPELSLYDVAKKELHPLSLQSLPEKCVWGQKKATLVYCAVPQTLPNATYPDQWYQGLVSFSDALWVIDATTFNTQRIMTPGNLGAPALDMVNLALSSNDAYLLFMNKVSGTPWVYSIIEPPKAVVAPPVSTATKAPATSATTETTVPPSVVTSGMKKLK